MTWSEFIKEEQNKSYFKNIVDFILNDCKTNDYKAEDIFPSRENLFLAFKLCPIETIKVVIIGQDPYPNVGQAHGLSFSVPNNVKILPGSLKNIFKELRNDIGQDIELNNGCLENWAKQGVFLLNSILTVRKGHIGSHKDAGWETFTDATIRIINDIDRPIVFLLWGAFAKSKKHLITNKKHLVLEAAHPSPLAAYNGFFGCKHFSKANDFLVKNNIDPVDWSIK